MTAISVIGKVSIRVFTCYVTYSEIHTTHELIHMVETQSSPCITLSRLDYYISACQSCLKREITHSFPIFLRAIRRTHIMDICLGYLTFVIPSVSSLNHLLYSASVVAIYTAKHSCS